MNLYHLLGEGAGAASIAVGFIALVGALAGALTSYLVAGRAVYVNTITVERSKWINKLRGNLAAYSAAIAQVKFRIVELSLPGEERDRVARIVDKMEGINHIAS